MNPQKMEKYQKKIDYWSKFYDSAVAEEKLEAAKKAWINIMKFQQILHNYEETGKFTLKRRKR